MMQRNTMARSVHDLGLAAWFGGSLMGAIGVDGASRKLADPDDRSRVVTTAWGRWGPVNAAAVVAYLVGSARLTAANRGRLVGQRGVGATAAAKTGLTVVALAASGYVTWEGMRAAGGDVRAGGEENSSSEGDRLGAATRQAAEQTAPSAAGAERARSRLRVVGWVVPAATGALVVLSAHMGEQQRVNQVLAGVLQALPGRTAAAARTARRMPAGRLAKAGTTAARGATKAKGAKAGLRAAAGTRTGRTGAKAAAGSKAAKAGAKAASQLGAKAGGKQRYRQPLAKAGKMALWSRLG